MKKEFEYWYPNDQRHTAVGHITNHLTFFIFNHAGIFAKKYWPRMISINEYVIREGAKMSKSKGNVMPLVDIPRKYSADFYRLYIASAADLQGVMDWREEEVKTVGGKLERMFEIIRRAQRVQGEINTEELDNCDKWFVSEINRKIKDATEFIENLEIRKYIQKVFFEVLNDVNYYQERADPKHVDKMLRYLSGRWIRLLSPVIPHICEELWEMMGRKGFVSVTAWPTPDEARIDIRAEENEALIVNTLEDTKNIIKATGITPKKICYYTAAAWKWKTYLKALERSISGKVVQSELMKELMKDSEMKKAAKQLAKFISQIADEVNRMSAERKQRQLKVGTIDENLTLKDAEAFFKREFNAEVYIYQEEDSQRYDPKNRAQVAKPYRPAIYIE
jgi:leucyl-tRNA synthetase